MLMESISIVFWLVFFYLVTGSIVSFLVWKNFYEPTDETVKNREEVAEQTVVMLLAMPLERRRQELTKLRRVERRLYHSVQEKLRQMRAIATGIPSQDFHSVIFLEDVVESGIFGLLWPLSLLAFCCVCFLGLFITLATWLIDCMRQFMTRFK